MKIFFYYFVPSLKWSFAFLCFLGALEYSFSQNEFQVISLEDSLNFNKQIFTTRTNIIDTIMLGDNIDNIIYLYQLSPESLLWTDSTYNKNFASLEYGITFLNNDSDCLTFFIRTNGTNEFINVEKFCNSSVDSITLRFPALNPEHTDSLIIPVKIALNNRNQIRFYPVQEFIGIVEIGEWKYKIILWPFQTGPFYVLHQLNGDSSTTEKFLLDEEFLLGSTICSFSDFNFFDKTVLLKRRNYDGEEPIMGYKEGQVAKFWNQKKPYLDSLSIDFNKPTLIYFGGAWCKPCQLELPRLKRIGFVGEKNGIQVLSVNYNINETEAEGEMYLKQNDFPGKHIVVEEQKNYDLIQDLNIRIFPTYVFLNENGEILFRGDSKKSRDNELELFFSQYLSKLKKGG